MGRKCMISSCEKLPKPSKGNGISYFKIPITKERKKWAEFIQDCNGATPHITAQSMVCSRHFKTCCFKASGRNRCIIEGHFPTQVVTENGNIIDSNTSNITHYAVPATVDSKKRKSSTDLTQIIKSLQQKISKMESKLSTANARIFKKNLELRILRQFKARYEEKRKPKEVKVSNNTASTSTQTNSVGLTSNVFDPYKTKNGKSYTSATRELATKVSYYSTAAYNALRKESGLQLPHIRTILNWSKWIKTSPGFLEQPMNHLKAVCSANPSMQFVLVFDEMAIRGDPIHVNNNGYIGFVDYGDLKLPKKRQLAKNALFVYAASINGSTRLPIAYFLTNGCCAKLMMEAIRESLIRMHNSGASVLGVVFDGLPANFNACKKLGSEFNFENNLGNLKTTFKHPASDEEVHCIPDVCHMEKLFRNHLRDKYEFRDQNGGIVSWKFFEELVKLQTKEGLHAANKATVRNINFQQQKMKVRLVTQLLSNSVAVALGACHEMGLTQFQGSGPTIEFVTLMDRLFDICNSRPGGQGYKAPLSGNNYHHWHSLFTTAKKYFLSLEVEETIFNRYGDEVVEWIPLISTKRGTCVKGWLILIVSIESIMRKYVIASLGPLTYLPTYRICQDVLELFFATIRRRLGLNNNPNAIQLQAALRAILAVKLDPSLNGNCLPVEDSTTTTLSIVTADCPLQQLMEELDDDLDDIPSYESLSLFTKNVVVYISGFVARKVTQMLDCGVCKKSLSVLDQVLSMRSDEFILMKKKQNGGLFIPSPDLVAVCKVTEQLIRSEHANGIDKMKVASISRKTLHLLLQEPFFEELRMMEIGNHTSEHMLPLLKLIVAQYSKIRFHHIARAAKLDLHPTLIRNKCNRTVIFSGQ